MVSGGENGAEKMSAFVLNDDITIQIIGKKNSEREQEQREADEQPREARGGGHPTAPGAGAVGLEEGRRATWRQPPRRRRSRRTAAAGVARSASSRPTPTTIP